MSDVLDRIEAARVDRSAVRWAQITAGAADLAEFPSRLLPTGDLTVTLAGSDLVAMTITLRAGVEYDLTPRRVTSISGSGQLWAIYANGLRAAP